MSRHRNTAGQYNGQYDDIRFGREGLFVLLQEKSNPREILYPGCSVHLTPAFFFPHIVFVDKDPRALAFFSDREAVLDLVRRHWQDQRPPHIQFICQDYTQPLPVREGGFDLILALFAGGISRACRSYLRMGGLLVSNNYQGDALDAAQDPQLSLIVCVQRRKGKYRFLEGGGEPPLGGSTAVAPTDYLRRTSTGFEYVDGESYYIFERVRARE